MKRATAGGMSGTESLAGADVSGGFDHDLDPFNYVFLV